MNIADYIKNNLPLWPNCINHFLLRINVFGSLVYGRSYRKIKKHLNEANPEQLLIESVNHAIRNVPYYRKRYKDTVILSYDDFREKIQFIDKEEVMSHWEEFLVEGIDWNKVVTGTTGGTSGKPLKLVMPKNRYSWEMAYMHSLWEKTGWHYHITGIIRNHDLHGKDYAINPIMKNIIFDPHRMSESYAKRIFNVLKKYHVKYVIAYPSNAYQFCKLCHKQNLNLGFINAFFCGSEEVTEEQRVFFDGNSIKILSFFGHSEKLILGSNDTKSWIFRMESNYGYCELIDKDGKQVKNQGEVGELTGTSFYNRYFPLIRYKTGDYATLEKDGRYLELSKIIGRWDKSLIYKMDGTTTSLTVLNLHGIFYEHIDGIQYCQDEVGYIKVYIIKNDAFDENDEIFIIDYLANAMGGKEYVQIEYVEKLIFQPNGKFLPLISKVNRFRNPS